MIINRIIGGLGNQMFQYAAGRALSLRLNEPQFFDLSAFSNYQLHDGFELAGVFQCNIQAATEEQIRDVLGWRSFQSIRLWLLKAPLKHFRGRCFVTEPHFYYWPGFNDIQDSCYLFGYWQSEKYFKPVADGIRQDFKFQCPLDGRNFKLSQQITELNSVSLHVRRGDYVSDEKTKNTHGVCSLEYYKDAIAYIAERIPSPCFFIFSDDIDWCREHLNLSFPCTFIDHNKGDESYRDMQLMSLCQHHIIANSSFGWWGAWLNPREDKVVIAPKQWFANDLCAKDVIPAEWITL